MKEVAIIIKKLNLQRIILKRLNSITLKGQSYRDFVLHLEAEITRRSLPLAQLYLEFKICGPSFLTDRFTVKKASQKKSRQGQGALS